jgi:prolyl-tRNA synthetase
MFKIMFEDRSGEKQFAWQNSWGLTTRSIGTMVMVHSDDKGLILPPRVAPVQVVIVPIFKKNVYDAILAESKALAIALEAMQVRVHVDDRDIYTPGWKYNYWELKGVPLRIELGPKDLENRTVRVVRRDTREAVVMPWTEVTQVPELLTTIQRDLFNKAKQNLDSRIIKASNWTDFMSALNARNFVLTPWCERIECEKAVKERSAADSKALSAQEQEILTGAAKTLNLPFDQEPCVGENCFACGEAATKRALWGRSY